VGDKYGSLLLVLLFFHLTALGVELKPGCFDFTTVPDPLVAPIPLDPTQDTSSFAQFPSGIDWAAARGIVARPIVTVYKLLLDHYTWKPPGKNKLETVEIQKPGFKDFHLVKIVLKPFPLIAITWEEEWAYALVDGTDTDPKKFLISYQKASGTSHLQHLCGSVILTALTPESTDVFLYEQCKASRRNAEDIANGHLGTLKTLRERPL